MREREREREGLNLPLGEFTKQSYNLQNLTAIIEIVYIFKIDIKNDNTGKYILPTTFSSFFHCKFEACSCRKDEFSSSIHKMSHEHQFSANLPSLQLDQNKNFSSSNTFDFSKQTRSNLSSATTNKILKG